MKKFRLNTMLFAHTYKTIGMVLRSTCCVFITTFFAHFIWSCAHFSSHHIHRTWQCICAWLYNMLPSWIHTHKTIPIYIKKHLGHLYTNTAIHSATVAAFITTLFLFLFVFWNIKSTHNTCKFVSIISARRWRFYTFINGKQSPIRIHQIPLLKHTESQHYLIAGTTGTGKSTTLHHIHHSLRRHQHRAIVVDTTGALTQSWRRSEDTYFNPTEPDTAAWALFNDYKTEEDFVHFSQAMIPIHGAQEPFWQQSSQTVLRTILSLSASIGIPQLRHLLFHTPLPQLIDILSTTPAQTLLTKEADKTAGSIVAHLNSATQGLRFLKTKEEILNDRHKKNTYLRRQQFSDQVPQFSIESWSQQAQPHWLFLTTLPHSRHALLPILSLMMDTTMRTLMSQPTPQPIPTWIIIDELPSMQYLPTLTTLAAEGRKYGIRIVACIQSIAQLEERYGATTARVLLDLFGTKIVFRCPNVTTAKWLSDSLGSTNSASHQEHIGMNHTQSPYWSSAHSQSLAPAVSAHDIMHLPDLHAFIKFPGNLSIIQHRFPYIQS